MNYVTEYLPEDIDRTQTFTCSFIHLEVLNFSDISQSEHQKADALSSSKRKMCVETDGETHQHPSDDTSSALKILVTDKQGIRTLAFELERHLDTGDLVGRQLALSGKIEVFNGIIFLNSKNCRYLDEDERNIANQPAYDFEIPSDYIFSEL